VEDEEGQYGAHARHVLVKLLFYASDLNCW